MPRQLTFVAAVVAWAFVVAAQPAEAQAVGTVQGTVVRADDGSPIRGVTVTVRGTGLTATTTTDGRYTLFRVPEGSRTLEFRTVGFAPLTLTVDARAAGTVTADARMAIHAIALGELVVTGASRAPERVVEAPAAVATVDEATMRSISLTGQVPLALANVPGVTVVQSGVNDFNLNSRGFNSSLNRRILVLQDGRDLALAFLGAQEWPALSQSLEDAGTIEMVRGPGSALYGANAFSGVLNIITPTARELAGTRVSISGGELETLRGDLRQAGVLADGRFGYRYNLGFYRSDSWSRSRTAAQDIVEEYQRAGITVNTAPASCGGAFNCIAVEQRPLSGSDGERDRLSNLYGSLRFDYYLDDGTVATLEGGLANVQNEVFVTGIGRVQVLDAIRPWARAAWAAERYNVMAWYSGRNSLEPQFSLQSGLPLEEKSAIYHVEGQYNTPFMNDQGRVVVGASVRQYNVNTQGTLMMPADDDRSDWYYSSYGQVEFRLTPQLRAVGAVRYDNGDLFDGQFSPKGALVYSVTPDQSVRFTVNRAFQLPNYSEFFLRVPAGAPANLLPLEMGLRASPLGPALAGVPVGELFTTSNAVPVLALGNSNLDVERITSFELGYKGQFGNRAFVTLDGYWSQISDFVTDLMPGVNPTYGPWTAPQEVPAAFRGALEQAVRDQLIAAGQPIAAFGMTRVGGGTSIVVSYANAGKVNEYGAELGIGYALTPELRVDGGFTLFRFTTEEQQFGQDLIPNTPRTRYNLGMRYTGHQGIDAGATANIIPYSFDWEAGIYSGWVRPTTMINVNAGYRIGPNFRVHGIVTNVLNQERYQMFGGSVIGRRALAGMTIGF